MTLTVSLAEKGSVAVSDQTKFHVPEVIRRKDNGMTTIVSEWVYPNDEKHVIMKLRIMLFGVLAQIAFPVVKQFQSDLYHDVHWIDQNVNGPMFFNYSVDEWGTYIGTDDYVLTGRKIPYRVFITGDLGKWTTAWKVVATPYHDTYTAEEETAEILADPDTMAAIAEAQAEIKD